MKKIKKKVTNTILAGFASLQFISVGAELSHHYLTPQRSQIPKNTGIIGYCPNDIRYGLISSNSLQQQSPGEPTQEKTKELKTHLFATTTGSSVACAEITFLI